MNYVYVAVAIAIFAGAAFVISDSKTNKKQEQTRTAPSAVESDSPTVPETNDLEVQTQPEAQATEVTPQEATAISDEVVPPASVVSEEESEAAFKVFSVTGDNFSFSEETITVNKGDTVTINFESTSGFHDWVVDEFNAGTDQVRPGTVTSVTFVADTAGTFEYYCSVGSHRAQGMIGSLVVNQ